MIPNRFRLLMIVGLLAVVPIAVMVAGGQPATTTKTKAGGDNKDADAITKSSLDFAAAFNKGDTKAIAAMWTDQGECIEASGESFTGRDAIEKAYADAFKDKAQGKIELEIRSLRFPSRDTAIEEGFIRHTPDGPGLPSSTMYTASHVREDGKWLIAYSREYGAGNSARGCAHAHVFDQRVGRRVRRHSPNHSIL